MTPPSAGSAPTHIVKSSIDAEKTTVTSERLPSPHRAVAAGILDSLRAATTLPVVVLAGPNGVDLAAAADQLCALDAERRPPDRKIRPKVVNLSFSEAKPDFRLTDFLTPQDQSGMILLVKNVEHLHPDALPAFEATVRQLAGAGVLCVCTVALPLPPKAGPALGEAFERLRRKRLIHHVNLRPIREAEIGSLVTATLGARPEPLLISRLWALTRGWPGAIVTALEIFRDNGMMRTVDRHAYLTGHCAPALSDNHELVLAIRRQGTTVWTVAKAVAVLSSLGEAVPRLIGEALGIRETQVLDALNLLEQAGTLRYRPAESAWRFRMPLVATALKTLLGPYERRRLGQLAVSALWSGDARCADPFYLADQLVAASRMVDPERARRELLANAEQAAGDDADRTIPWLRAAADLTVNRAERAEILLAHAQTCMVRGKAELSLESLDTVLLSLADEIPEGQLVPVCFGQLAALHESRDLETLEKVARGDWWPWPGTPLERAIGRAFGLSLLGRWQETHDLLEATRREYDDVAAEYIGYISPITNVWLGLTDEFDRDLSTLPARVEAGEAHIGEVICHSGALLALGELDRAESLIACTRKLRVRESIPARMLRAVMRGQADEALELIRKHIATSSPNGCDAYETVMFQQAVMLQLLRGKLARGRELLSTARSRQPTLPHVLAVSEAWFETVYGEPERSQSILLDALRQAESEGIVAHTDLLWVNLADIDVRVGRTDQLQVYLQNVEKVAAQIGTESAELRRLTLHALVHSDRTAAEAALTLARRRAQPMEQAAIIDRLVRYGVAEPALLSEVYDLLGGLDALLSRAWLRLHMRDHGVPVPGRQATLAENERLLAVLVVEGLGNKQIARVLLTSEKSVEGRLSRLFARTGYQSRVELATAMLSGQFS